MGIIDNLEIAITRWSNGYNVRGITITGGEPDPCGHRHVVNVYQYVYGGGFLIQANFSDFNEQRSKLEDAYAVALKLASFIDPTVPVDTYAPEAE